MPKKLIAVGAALAVALAAVPAFAATKTKTIRVDDDVFKPKSVSVHKGDKVRFRWVGDAPHNVMREKGPSFKRIGTRRSGSVTRKLNRRGTYRLACSIHPGMNLKIRVR